MPPLTCSLTRGPGAMASGLFEAMACLRPTRSIVGKAQPTAVVTFRFKDMSDLTLFFGGIEQRFMEDPK
jgi:hypothetical protein